IKASNPGEEDHFGHAIALSGDGNTLAVGAPMESSAATGINGKGEHEPGDSSGAVYVYSRNGTRWAQQAYIKASNAGSDDQFGFAVTLSGDGNTLAVSAPYEDSAATGVNGNQADNSIPHSGALYVLTRSSGTWSQQARLQASNAEPQDSMGCWVAISDDGNTIAAGSLDEDSLLTGIQPPDAGANDEKTDKSAGAAYVFVRNGTTWSQ